MNRRDIDVVFSTLFSGWYVIIGDLNHKGKLQNLKNGPEPDDTGVILRINPDESEYVFNTSHDNTLF
jgi:hypothetical protein